jgi:hypothetical protein
MNDIWKSVYKEVSELFRIKTFDKDHLRVDIVPGKVYRITMPYSEVCMHMKIAGKKMWVALIGTKVLMANLFDPEHDCRLPAITPSEAGIYYDQKGYYVYEAEEV